MIDWGIVVGVVGCLVAVIGGVVGTFGSVKNTHSARERAFTIKASVIGWVAILLFLIAQFTLNNPWRWLVWIPYMILLPVGIVTWNRIQQKIRQEEAATNKP